MNFSGREIDMLFNYMWDYNKTRKISLSDIDALFENEMSYKNLSLTKKEELKDECESIILRLIGYKMSLNINGSHKNDGQLVEYNLTLVSPEGKTTCIETEMCLMVGWNNNDVIIK
jgi:hypothetical protein